MPSILGVVTLMGALLTEQQAAGDPGRVDLARGWSMRSSADVRAEGAAISRPGFATTGWYRVTVPSTVVGALVTDSVYRDPYFGMNLRKIPGESYPIGGQVSKLPMPEGRPLKGGRGERTEVTRARAPAGRGVDLHLCGRH